MPAVAACASRARLPDGTLIDFVRAAFLYNASMDAHPQVFIKPRKAAPFFGRHPWVLATAVDRINGEAAAGDVVDLLAENGHWIARAGEKSADVEIASILVQARPERLDAAARAIEALPGAQIYSRDAKGKLVVVIEAADTGSVGATLNAISSLPHVLSASLDFQGSDPG